MAQAWEYSVVMFNNLSVLTRLFGVTFLCSFTLAGFAQTQADLNFPGAQCVLAHGFAIQLAPGLDSESDSDVIKQRNQLLQASFRLQLRPEMLAMVLSRFESKKAEISDPSKAASELAIAGDIFLECARIYFGDAEAVRAARCEKEIAPSLMGLSLIRSGVPRDKVIETVMITNAFDDPARAVGMVDYFHNLAGEKRQPGQMTAQIGGWIQKCLQTP